MDLHRLLHTSISGFLPGEVPKGKRPLICQFILCTDAFHERFGFIHFMAMFGLERLEILKSLFKSCHYSVS